MVELKLIHSRYQLQERIGQGGMGDVFRGLDTQTGAIVAIKALKKEVLEDDPDILTRFKREGELLAQLNHPNIVKSLDSVEQDSTYYLIMEYVGGGDLAGLLKQQSQLPINRVLQIALDLCDALTRAHRLKVIHRDIKPSNILLAEDGTPRLTDFGVARMNDNRTQMTRTGSMVGTYSYLSPEAVQAELLDARTDIWAFGVMLFEMLTGQRPFDRGNSTATLMAIINNPVPDLKSLRPDTPDDLVYLIERMLEKNRNSRISSIRQVGAEIEAIIEQGDSGIRQVMPALFSSEGNSRFATPTPSQSQAVLLHTPGFQPPDSPDGATINLNSRTSASVVTPAPAALPTSANRLPLIAGGILALVILAGMMALLLMGGRDDQQAANEPAATATPGIVLVEPVAADQTMVLVADFEPLTEQERDISRFIVENLEETIETGIPMLRVVIRPYPGVITSEEQAREIGIANQAALVIWGNYTEELIEAQLQIGDTTSLLLDAEMIDESSTVRLEMTSERRQTLAPHVIAALVMWNGHVGETYRAAANLISLEQAEGEPATIKGSNVAAQFYRYFDSFFSDPAQALEEVSTAVSLDSTNPMTYHFRGVLNQQLGNLAAAEQDLNTAIRLTNRTWLPPIIALANNKIVEGDNQAAIDLFTETVTLRPNDWFAYTLRGAAHYFKQDYAAARADYETAIAQNPPINMPYVALSSVTMRQGEITETIDLMQQALAASPDPEFAKRLVIVMSGGNQSINNFNSLSFSAFTNMILGQYNAAIVDAEAALAINDDYADFYLLKGLAHCNLQEYAEAEAAYSAGLEVEPDLAILNLMRAEVRQRQNNLVGALQDISVVQASDLWASVEPLMADPTATSCETFFN